MLKLDVMYILVLGDQINSNKEPEIKSKKVPFDEYAKYCFKIWKNDNGHKGEYVGDF